MSRHYFSSIVTMAMSFTVIMFWTFLPMPLIVLLNNRFPWLVTILLVVYLMLLLSLRILLSWIVPLVDRHRSRGRNRSGWSFVPSFPAFLPFGPPMLTPVRGPAWLPSAKVWRRESIVTYRDLQDVDGHR